MKAYVLQIWACRWFWYSLVRMDLRARYRGSVLGMGWSLLNPIAMTVIFCTVFATLLNQDIHFYAPYVMAGIAVWNFFLHSTLEGCQCFLRAESYIRQYPAPMAIYPLRNTLSHGFHLVLATFLVIGLTLALRGWPGFLPILSVVGSIPIFLVGGFRIVWFGEYPFSRYTPFGGNRISNSVLPFSNHVPKFPFDGPRLGLACAH